MAVDDIASLNVAYEEEEKRSFLRYNLTALFFTLCGGRVLARRMSRSGQTALGPSRPSPPLGCVPRFAVMLDDWPTVSGSLIRVRKDLGGD